MTKHNQESKTARESRSTIVSNIDYVTIGSVRCHASLLLIEQGPASEHVTVCGFAYSVSNPTFTLFVDSYDHKFVGFDSDRLIVISDDGTQRPMVSGVVLEIGGHRLQIDAKYRGSVDILELDDPDSVAGMLEQKLCEHWVAPNMPVVVWLPTAKALDLRKQVAAKDGAS